MKVRLRHHVIFREQVHRFTVVVECPFTPPDGFLFVFRSESKSDDCALVVDRVEGWDVTNEYLLVHTKEWDVDDWHTRGGESLESEFKIAVHQLTNVAGCRHSPPG